MWNKIQHNIHRFYRIFLHETKESFEDAGTVLIFIVAAILYPMLYSTGYVNETIREIPVALVDLNHTTLSRRYAMLLDATEQVSVTARPGSLKDAEKLFYQGIVHGVVLIPVSFQEDILKSTQANVVVYCDAGRFFVYKQVYTGASYATGVMNAGVEIKGMLANVRSLQSGFGVCNIHHSGNIDHRNPAISPGRDWFAVRQAL